jgi:hypothetical protein
MLVAPQPITETPKTQLFEHHEQPTETPTTQVLDNNEHDSYMSEDRPGIWHDPSMDLVSYLSTFVRQKEVPHARFKVRFHETGRYSVLAVYDGERYLGHLRGDDLLRFLSRALTRIINPPDARAGFLRSEARRQGR